jgi:O-antigen polymerase
VLKKLIPLTLLLCIGFSLINAGTFGEYSYFAYFFYTVLVCAFAVLVSFSGSSSQNLRFQISIPGLFFLLLALYIFLHGIITGTLWLTHYYWIINAILLLSVSYWIGSANSKQFLALVFKGIVFFAVAESVTVIMQHINIVPTASKYFSATGTWINPNVTAMFLTMAFPVILFRLFNAAEKYKKLQLLFLLVVTAALLMLKCRTAIIGTAIVAGIILNSRHSLLQRIRIKYSGLKIVALASILFAIIVGAGYMLYKAKQDSADGRILVWKISAAMVAEKPLTGYGYGSFEKAYNFSQADYFADGKGTEPEKINASFVRMAYNEFLQNAVEGGAIGFSLFVLMLASLLLSGIRKNLLLNKGKIISTDIVSYSGIVAFTVMSIFNFTVQAIPVMAVFILYVSLASKNYKQIYLPVTNKIFKQVAIGAFMSTCLFIGVYQIMVAKAYATNKNISKLIREGKSNIAINQLQSLQGKLENADSYWINYGNALVRQKDYNGAIYKYTNAINLKPYCETYLLLAQCYQKIKRSDSAINACIAAKNMAPNRMLPTFALMQVYAAGNDTLHAVAQAKELISIKPKVKSKEAMLYKFKAMQLCKQFKGSEGIN